MAWNTIRRATTEDEDRLDRAEQAFVKRHHLQLSVWGAITPGYGADETELTECKRLARLWLRCMRRALRSSIAEGIAWWGDVGYHVE